MRRSPTWPKVAMLVGDLLVFVLCFLIGLFGLRFYGNYDTWDQWQEWWVTVGESHALASLAFILFCLFRFYSNGAYSERRPFWEELRLFLGILLTVAALHGVVVLIAKWPFVRSVWLISWASAALLLPAGRYLVRRLLTSAGLWQRKTVIIGRGETALAAYKALMSEPRLGFQVTHFVSVTSSPAADLPIFIPVFEVKKETLVDALQEIHPDQVVIALEDQELAETKDCVEELSLHFQELHLVPSLSGLPLFEMEASHFFSHEVLLLKSRNNLHFRPRIWLKRSFDIVASFTLILIISPLLIWIALRIRSTGPGVLFKHKRVGQKGRNFSCYKFRSMALNAEKLLKDILERDPQARAEWQEKMKLTNDPRITSIGHFLRKTSLDELPQLWNVLRGDMSLVGPRPIVESEMIRYGNRIDFYTCVKPGITGLWQVSGRSDTDYKTRVQLDTWYVKNWTLWVDIAILFKTIKVVVNRSGAY